MKFHSTAIRGHGRGKGLGFPTINLVVPSEVALSLGKGIYASRVKIGDEVYGGALYFGPASTFGETENQLEVYLIDSVMISVEPGEEVEVEVVRFIRPPEAFSGPELLVMKMEEDVEKVRKALGM